MYGWDCIYGMFAGSIEALFGVGGGGGWVLGGCAYYHGVCIAMAMASL